jgi:hypothetical protein
MSDQEQPATPPSAPEPTAEPQMPTGAEFVEKFTMSVLASIEQRTEDFPAARRGPALAPGTRRPRWLRKPPS